MTAAGTSPTDAITTMAVPNGWRQHATETSAADPLAITL
jgi:hypothetical protein